MGVQRLYLRGNRIAIFTTKGVFLNSCKRSFIWERRRRDKSVYESGKVKNGEPAETIIRLLERERESQLTFIAVGLDRFA